MEGEVFEFLGVDAASELTAKSYSNSTSRMNLFGQGMMMILDL